MEYDYLGMDTIVGESRPMVTGCLALSYGSGTTYAGFDRFGRVVGQEWRKTDGTLVDGYGYTYDPAGNRTSKTNLLNSAYSETHGYDGLNRLVSATRNGTALQGWELDSLGNWDSTTTSTGTQTREHNSANEITDISEGVVPAHDAAGNMTSMPTGSGYVARMRYDAWNRLVSVEYEVAPDAWVEYACYGYDGLGQLVTTGHFPGTIDYYYNENHQFIEIRDDMPGYEYTEVSQFVWSLRYIDAPVMGYIETDREAVTTLVRQYYTQDANFNITASVDGATGAVMGRAVYTPYGKRTQLGANWSGTGDVGRFGHQGLMEMRDSAGTGLYYNRARFYHPTLGRFVQRDPLGYVDGGSLYEYVRSGPVGAVDPTGTAMHTGASAKYTSGRADWSWWERLEYRFWTSIGAADPEQDRGLTTYLNCVVACMQDLEPGYRVARAIQGSVYTNVWLGWPNAPQWLNDLEKAYSKSGFSSTMRRKLPGTQITGKAISRVGGRALAVIGAYEFGTQLYCANKCRETGCP